MIRGECCVLRAECCRRCCWIRLCKPGEDWMEFIQELASHTEQDSQIPHSESIHYPYLNYPSSNLILPSLAFPANPSPSWAFPLRRSPVLRACFPIQMHSPPLHLKNANDPLSLFVPDSFPIPSRSSHAMQSSQCSQNNKYNQEPRSCNIACVHLSTAYQPSSLHNQEYSVRP